MPHLHFKGKTFVQNHHLAVPFHELIPVADKGLSQKPSLHDNLILQGDNLKALKALLPTYQGKVKCIYIDPPYNTGNEGWAYNDNVNSPMMQSWLGKTVDREDLTRHDKWCCMMLPRLKLLRELLTEDGAIFVSIDDNEVHHLRCLMDEVFGEENFVANVVWEKKYSASSDHKGIAPLHDHIIAYRKSEIFQRNLLERSDSKDSQYKHEDAKGVFRVSDYTCNKTAEERPNLYYPITNPHTGEEVWPKKTRVWGYSKDLHDKHVSEDLIFWGVENKAKVPGFKRYRDQLKGGDGVVPATIWAHEEVGHTDSAKKELNVVFPDGGAREFVTVKPTSLITRILQIATEKDSIILDSFAGSGTTAHAVAAQNAEDGGNRRFVLIECEDYVDNVTAERVRRVMRGVPTAKDAKLKAGYGGSFSYFKLGEALEKQAILDGEHLPSFETLAGYVFFTATGEQFDGGKIDPKTGFIGESRNFDVFLLYQADVEALKNMALTLDTARALPSHSGKPKLVFAPTKYLEEETLRKLQIVFHQLPFEIYQRMDAKRR
ncbi:MAG: site-specific DNA-methyltransferase [Puniceicoccaceae bacterium]|nr:MAG: site-specific DNA-methyltransferase [Puniceicoccaceae bacterium]